MFQRFNLFTNAKGLYHYAWETIYEIEHAFEDQAISNRVAGELITIPPRILNREHEEYISLLERLLYDNSSPRLPEDFHANPNTIIESLPTFPIPVEDSDSLREEIDIFPGPDDSIPPGIEEADVSLGMVIIDSYLPTMLSESFQCILIPIWENSTLIWRKTFP
ncbi:hypothetical protein Tco_0098043 [Tanacetum coccineum]